MFTMTPTKRLQEIIDDLTEELGVYERMRHLTESRTATVDLLDRELAAAEKELRMRQTLGETDR